MEKEFDFAITGTGVAGLSLAYLLKKEGLLKNKSLLMLDQRKPDLNDKTWSFWHHDSIPFSELALSRYMKFRFVSSNYTTEKSIAPYTYSMIRAIDFYQYILRKLKASPNISWHFDKIKHLESDGQVTQISTENGEEFKAKICFNSAVPNYLIANPNRFIHLKQHFLGWVVNFGAEVFTPETFTLHDFDIPQQGLTQFIYILPYSSREALVEFTIFSPEVVPKEYYENHLENYLQRKFGLPYQVTHQEFGIIPMTDDPFENKNPPNLINIGTVAGAVKPSTGYGFKRITRHTLLLVKALKAGKPLHKISPKSKWHYQWLDSIMLEVLKSHGDKGARIFSGLFQNRSPQAIFRFLDEKANLLQIISIMLAMPYKHLFFISMLRVLGRKVLLGKFIK